MSKSSWAAFLTGPRFSTVSNQSYFYLFMALDGCHVYASFPFWPGHQDPTKSLCMGFDVYTAMEV